MTAPETAGPDPLSLAKRQLRRTLLARRGALPADYIRAASLSIQRAVLRLPEYRAARSLFAYISLPEEVSTGLLLRQALADGKRLYVPKCLGRDMLAVRIRSLEGLRPGPYGIPEPADASETAPADTLDLILAPCVAATPDGRRLGHGAGYYDRFLQGRAGPAFCLCFRALLLPELPTGVHDVPLPVLTEPEGLAAVPFPAPSA